MSDEAALREMIKQWSNATDQPGDAGADGYVAFVADDIVVLPPNEEKIVGKDAVRTWCLGFTGSDGWTVSWAADDLDVAESGDLACGYGRYELRTTDEDGNLVEDNGTWLDTFKKQPDGSWKATAIAFNSDLPAESE